MSSARELYTRFIFLAYGSIRSTLALGCVVAGPKIVDAADEAKLSGFIVAPFFFASQADEKRQTRETRKTERNVLRRKWFPAAVKARLTMSILYSDA
jgi:hypothetical protein